MALRGGSVPSVGKGGLKRVRMGRSLRTASRATRYLGTLVVPVDSVTGPDLNRAGGGAASADRVGHPGPVARLHHAEPDALASEDGRAVRGHVKDHPGSVHEE